METNSINTKPTPHHVYDIIRCGICRNELKKGATIFQEGLSFGVVCEKCYKNNSPDDLELMANLFMAYGGYFGIWKDSDYSLYKVLKTLTSGDNGNSSIIELNINLLHQGLLHGICPHQFRQVLKILLE